AQRWFAMQINRLTLWMVLIVLFPAVLGFDELRRMFTGESWAVLLSRLNAAWPIWITPLAFILALRWLRWPQLLRPTAVAIACAAASGLTGTLSLIAAGIATSEWDLVLSMASMEAGQLVHAMLGETMSRGLRPLHWVPALGLLCLFGSVLALVG